MSDTPRTDAVFTGIEPDNRDGRIMAAWTLARRLERELAEAKNALERYGQHEEGCPVIVTESLCNCGLTLELASLRARAKK